MRFVQYKNIQNLFNFGAFLFIGSALVSTYYALDQAKSLAKLASYLTAFGLYYWMLFKNRDLKNVEKLYDVMIVVMLLASLYAIYQFFTGQYYWAQRVTSITTHPNSFAKFLLIIMPFVIAKILDPSIKERFRVSLGIIFLIMAIGMIFTYARGAWLGLFAATFLIVVATRKLKIMAFLGGMLGIALFFVPNMLSRFLSIFDIYHVHNVQRIYGWKASLAMIQDHPITGLGLRNFGHYYKAYVDPQATEMLGHAHNIFLVFATEIGLFGLAGFLCMIISVYIGGLAVLRRRNVTCGNYVYVLGAIASITGTLTYGLNEYVFNNDIQLLLFWITLAYINLAVKKELDNSAPN
jgi:putative inorganic carbon (hco3(-)) transporter